MPAVSERQRRAMWAAAEGHSRLGIPQSVGKEFVGRHDIAESPGDDLTDYEAAEAIRDGELPSPTQYGDFFLFDMRVTGTGAAYREKLGEYGIRDPDEWTSDEFVQRCNGLAVIFEHPPDSGLNTEEWRERAIGTIVLPYVKNDEHRGPEVWGIAKIFDKDAANMMAQTHTSTSPGVTPPKGSESVTLENGDKVLHEGLPLVLDHLAVCEIGVWDKDGPPAGVRLDSIPRKVDDVAKTVEELTKERDDAQALLDSAIERRDGKRHDGESEDREEEERDDARHDDDDDNKKDAKRDDEGDKESIEAAEKEKADAKKRDDDKKRKDTKRKDDDRKKKHDAKKHDGDYMDCSRCDSESEEEEEEAEERDDKKRGRKDEGGAPKHEPDGNEGTDDIRDSQIRDLQAEVRRLSDAQKPLSIDDQNELAKQFHRYDSICQMLGDTSPRPYPGEKPIAFRKRAASLLRPYTTSFKNYKFHDAQTDVDVKLVEDAILDEATKYAKNPPADKTAGQLREVKTRENGKDVSRFIGDAKVAYAPFCLPKRSLVRINKPEKGAAV